MNSIRRPAITRPEVLVLLSLAVAVTGFALPAVAKVRAESNRQRCQNNLKLVGEAVLKYADAHKGALPGGIRFDGLPANSVIFQILPYSEHSGLAEKIAKSQKPWHDPVNAEIVAHHLAFAQCPDAPKSERILEGTIAGNSFKAAPTDYTAVPLITEAIRDIFPDDYDRSSALGGLGGSPRLNEISDGLSTSLMGIVEIADKPNRWRMGKLEERGGGMGGAEGTWAANGLNAPRGYTLDGKFFPGPCAMNCTNVAAVYSFHPEGCNFLFADNSVRFLKKELDVWVFYAVFTRRGGELLAPGDY